MRITNYKLQILKIKIFRDAWPCISSFAGKIFRSEVISEDRKLCLSFKGKGILRENR